MAIDFDRFLAWAEARFDDIRVKGDEIKLNSIFTEDYKHKLWCNPNGGKHERENGVFHCWKTERKGSLITLVMLVDQCDYSDAMEKLGGEDVSLRQLEKRLAEFFEEQQTKTAEEKIEEARLQLPENTYLISNLSPSNFYRVDAEVYLLGRGISTDGLMICTAGEYRERIIVPYYDKNNKLIYFNGRYIGRSTKVAKYRGPDKDLGIGKEDVLFMPEWPEDGTDVYLTEGEFDAISIYKCGLNAGAFGGKVISDSQAMYLRNYRPIVATDNDKAGKVALPKIADSLVAKGFKNIGYVKPSTDYKDWNEMLQRVGESVLRLYLTKGVKRYNDIAGDIMKYDNIIS